MTNRHEFTVRFVTPDNVEEENVLLVLREFFGDLIETDRFIDAVVEVGEYDMNDSEAQRMEEMVADLSDEEIEKLAEYIEELEDG